MPSRTRIPNFMRLHKMHDSYRILHITALYYSYVVILFLEYSSLVAGVVIPREDASSLHGYVSCFRIRIIRLPVRRMIINANNIARGVPKFDLFTREKQKMRRLRGIQGVYCKHSRVHWESRSHERDTSDRLLD